MKTMYNWLHKNAIVTLFLILWSVILVSWVVYRVFGDIPPDIPTNTVAALGTVFGLPALAFGLWKWRVGDNK